MNGNPLESLPTSPLEPLALDTATARVRGRRFSGGRAETYLLVVPTVAGTFEAQWAAVTRAYGQASAALGLTAETELFVGVCLADPAADAAAVKAWASSAGRPNGGAWSILGQPPLEPFGTHPRVVLRAAHLERPDEKRRGEDGTLTVQHGAYTQVWLPDLASADPRGAGVQSDTILGTLRTAAEARDLPLCPHLVRTWIAVRDIDADYAALLASRRTAYAAASLVSPLPASTGINGVPALSGAAVSMTALLFDGLAPEQIVPIAAPDHLPPAPSYGATFERGLVLRFGDRRHLHISGTASIGPEGDVWHVGDVRAQTLRTIVNLRALLAAAGADFPDLCWMLVYLRNGEDAAAVVEELEGAGLGALPRIVLHAPVCRPTWLVEIEAVGVDGRAAAGRAPF